MFEQNLNLNLKIDIPEYFYKYSYIIIPSTFFSKSYIEYNIEIK